MHELDEVDRLRRTLVPQLDKALKPLGLYAQNVAHPEEYAFTIPGGVEEAEKLFHDLGILRNGLAGFKTLEPYGVEENGSWAWRYNTGNFETYRFWGDRQIHFTLFEAGEETHVLVHDELNPWRHPIGHYGGFGGGDDVRIGWAKEKARELFADYTTKVYATLDRPLTRE